ncbi:helix-turn-helix domain-containing protein [Ulvibacterium marinum]|uniref:Helix-turn-helix domain-containing protein n=1 Tax=Ulvibacterium marinum TaxID=2419782 RepID=A0A3B0C682_9FLAO|nr:AraC family transcriptional regulator [Ulvibacterium marinum]RKN79694.1 helix-turn-helix domain-containing protein [Ulvibacterium marinum]
MKSETLHNYNYQEYLKRVLQSKEVDVPIFIATEKEFASGEGIDHPYRSNFYSFGLLHQSECRLHVGINEYHLKKGSLTMVGPGIVRNWSSNSWDMANTTVFFKESLFGRPFYDNFLLDYDFFKVGANHVIDLSDEEYGKLNLLLEQLKEFMSDRSIASGLLFSILEFIDGIYDDRHTKVPMSRNDEIARDFNELLLNNYRHQKNVDFYAEKLNLSSKHLSDVLKGTIGKTVKQAIEEMVIFETQSLLKQTSMDVKEILYLLGYKDASYFTKFFKGKTGLTPSNYRLKG